MLPTRFNTGKYNFNRVEQLFKYIRTIVSEHNKIVREVAVRIQIGNKRYYGLT